MSFQSALNGAPIIDNFTDPLLDARHGGKGHVPRDFSKEPFGSMAEAIPFDMPLIPRSEWDERIEDMEKSKTSTKDLVDAAGMPVKHQGQTNYCWINAPIWCLQVIRLVMGLPAVSLSPASVGAKIKRFQNVGGWGTEGLKYLVDHGAASTARWPDNAIDRRYDTPAAEAERASFRVQEWYDIQPKSFDALATALLLRFPTAIGLNWWRHEITAMRLVKLDGTGRYGVEIANSWGASWGQNGYAILTEAKATPDDAVAPRSAIAA